MLVRSPLESFPLQHSPVARARVEDGFGRAGLIALVVIHGRLPGALGDQEHGIHVRDDADLVAPDLVVAPAGVLGFRGGETIGSFHFRAAAALFARGEFGFVVVEIVVDAVEFAAQIVLLAGANAGE